MKQNFLQPIFDGDRFSEHTLPLEVAKDLAAYEVLVIELAKHLYMKDNPERERVPKGFAADFHLHLEKVDEGSAKPLLSLVAASILTLGAGEKTYFERARELIAECVAASDGQLPGAFPREMLSHFNQVGRSLLPDERMELPLPNGTSAVLTPDRRKRLVLAADRVYEREVELLGTIEEADWGKSSFRLRFPTGGSLVIPMPNSFHPQARQYGGRSRYFFTVKGIGTFDSWDKLQKVISVESLEIQPNYQLTTRFDMLLKVEDGWLDGVGRAPDKTKLSVVAEKMIAHYPEQLPLPVIVPTPEGDLLFEWDISGTPSVDLNLGSLRAYFHQFKEDGTENERELALSSNEEWKLFFGFLSETLEHLPS